MDPYYLTQKAEEVGYHPEILLAGRRINDRMDTYVASQVIKQMLYADKAIKGSNVLVLSVTFKENVGDVRDSKIVDTIRELQSFGMNVLVCDAMANPEEVSEEYGIKLSCLDDLPKVDVFILAVVHREYRTLSLTDLKNKMRGKAILADLKGVFSRAEAVRLGFDYFSL